uniref:Uncharacterized protein n=1 Tax=Arundo donax TaxID=35708 RepID=A0A0A9EJU7_ARUDO
MLIQICMLNIFPRIQILHLHTMVHATKFSGVKQLG